MGQPMEYRARMCPEYLRGGIYAALTWPDLCVTYQPRSRIVDSMGDERSGRCTHSERPVSVWLPDLGPLCESCWRQCVAEIDNRQALEEGATAPPPPAPAVCRHCTLTRDRFPTGYGRWVLLEPADYQPTDIPPPLRWRICDDGVAVRLGDPVPAAVTACRVLHAAVCPNQEELELHPAHLRVLRQLNAGSASASQLQAQLAGKRRTGHEGVG